MNDEYVSGHGGRTTIAALQSLHGGNLVGTAVSMSGTSRFKAVDPRRDVEIDPAFHEATSKEIDEAVALAGRVSLAYGRIEDSVRADFLRGIAQEIEDLRPLVIERAILETGRDSDSVEGELARCVTTCELFADIAEQDWWRDVRVDSAPDGTTRPDLRRRAVPIGPVLVFGASNIPLMGATAGTDVVAALAAGCPVVVKGHPGHPGVSELLATAVLSAAARAGVPSGTFSLLQGVSSEVGLRLAQAPEMAAIAFTGSTAGGRAIFDAAARRPDPIPVYAEMGSVNPVLVLPSTATQESEEFATGLARSIVANSGQNCTKPGVVAVPEGPDGDRLVERSADLIAASELGPLLHRGVLSAYEERLAAVVELPGVVVVAGIQQPLRQGLLARGIALSCSAGTFLAHPELRDEIFGPAVVFVRYSGPEELSAIARSFPGQLAAALWGQEDELGGLSELVDELVSRVGRIVWRSFPPGTSNSTAMQHGGPYPAATDPRTTSVGHDTIRKFVRPVAYQNFPEAFLPSVLRR